MPDSRQGPRQGWPARIGVVVLSGLLALGLGSAGMAVAQPSGTNPIAAELVQAFDNVFGGEHPGFAAVHSRGIVLEGRFLPAASAATLTRASHLTGGLVPVVVRFSNFPGNPAIADGAGDASPRGMAIRFKLPDNVDTDIVAHSYNGFPAATPQAFLAFLRAVPDSATLKALAAGDPVVRAFLDAPKPTPASYATEAYFGVNAFRFANAAGEQRVGRYRLVPLAGERHLDRAEAAAQLPDFLFQEMSHRLALAPVKFRLEVQLAIDGDQTSDGSRPWPDDRPTVELGTLELSSLSPAAARDGRDPQFIPTSLVGGILPSDDPMLLARTQAYRRSALRRRAGQ